MIEIKVDTDQLERSLTQLSQRLVHRRPLMKKLAAVMHNAVDENFEAEGRPKWLGIKHRQGRVLRDSGALQNSISERSDDDTAIVGTNLPYAAIHQFGGPIQKPARTATVRYRSEAGRILFAGRKHANATAKQVNIPAHQVDMPARPYLGISAADDKEIREIISDWVIGQSK